MNSKKFVPVKLPSNEYAYKSLVYLNPNDYAFYKDQLSDKKGALFFNIKGFIVKSAPLEDIPPNGLGLSSF
jgi:hypothetical protein